METMLCHRTLLRTVLRAHRKVDARGLTDLLREEGFEASERTIERDLRKLMFYFYSGLTRARVNLELLGVD